MTARDRYPAVLLTLFSVWFVALGIAPHFRQDWLLENLLVFVIIALLVTTYRRLRFSNLAYTGIFAFLVLHEIGAHHTYSLVPYDAWAAQLTGRTISDWFGFERNHFDRVVHFLYGICFAPATLELFEAKAPPKGIWRFILPVAFMNSHAVLYETLEWVATAVFGGELGAAYLGTQGDVFDAQKDMALAFAGSVIALSMLVFRRRRESSSTPRSSASVSAPGA
jgi:putative membrane protein